jgi:SAM-dependent methyltransferase
MPQDMQDATDSQLAGQYEAYPYPPRDPRDEAKRLVIGSPSHLREVDYWVFGANRPRSQPMRVLVAGGGTGDGAIMLAAHMAALGQPGSVTYLDRSAAAMKIARARAEARGLRNIAWHQGSLLDLPMLGLGPFDYIDCCGVLHHLPDPEAGLRALAAVLAPGGGMGLMLYAPHGRTGVYMLQDALRLLAPPEEAPAARLDAAKRLMRNLPATAWLRRNPYFSDHLEGGDAGLYDLLLNPRDRAFDVPALHELVRSAGMEVACLVEPLRYDPALYLPEPRLRARAAALDTAGRATLAEAVAGNMPTHVFYCARAGEIAPRRDPLAADSVPVARETPGPELARMIAPDGTFPLLFHEFRAPLPLPPLAAAILRLVDGQRSVGAIGTEMAARGVDEAAFALQWQQIWTAMSSANRILLAPPA